jgi:hypothetical protein
MSVSAMTVTLCGDRPLTANITVGSQGRHGTFLDVKKAANLEFIGVCGLRVP